MKKIDSKKKNIIEKDNVKEAYAFSKPEQKEEVMSHRVNN